MLSGIGAAAAAFSLFVCAFIYEEERGDGGAPSESPCGLIRCKCMYGVWGDGRSLFSLLKGGGSVRRNGRPPNQSLSNAAVGLWETTKRRMEGRKAAVHAANRRRKTASRRPRPAGRRPHSLARSHLPSLPPPSPHRLDFLASLRLPACPSSPSPPFTPLDRKRPRLRPPQASKARPLAGNPERERPMGRDLENADGPNEEGRNGGEEEEKEEGATTPKWSQIAATTGSLRRPRPLSGSVRPNCETEA